MPNPYETPQAAPTSDKTTEETVHYRSGCWTIGGLALLLVALLFVCGVLFADEDGGVFFLASLTALFGVSCLAISLLRGVKLTPASRFGYSVLFAIFLGVLGIFSTVILLAAVCFGALAIGSSGVIDDANLGSTLIAILVPGCFVLGILIASFAVARLVRAIVASNHDSSLRASAPAAGSPETVVVGKEAEESDE